MSKSDRGQYHDQLIEQVDSTAHTSVIVCSCGHRSLGTGINPERNARRWQDLHRALIIDIAPREYKPTGTRLTQKKRDLLDAVLDMHHLGVTRKEIAKQTGLYIDTVSAWIKEADREAEELYAAASGLLAKVEAL